MHELIIPTTLGRIFPDQVLEGEKRLRLTAIAGETVSCQIAWRSHAERGSTRIQLKTEGTLATWARLRTVGLVPSAYPAHPDRDEHYERTAPGLFPDVLEDLAKAAGVSVAGQWRSGWVDLQVPESADEDLYTLEIQLTDLENLELGRVSIELQVLPGTLPAQKLLHTEWFHTDCLADYYAVEPRSDAWWEIVGNFARCAAERGINMLLTPVFTPPLDTRVGAERTTVQLVNITETDGQYSFDFRDLERWVRMCQTAGIRYFEMPHLFTQWGAGFAPKIVVTTAAGEEKRFGWHTEATSEQYRDFLEQFLPALIAELGRLEIKEQTLFHISDEPGIGSLDAYQAAANQVRPLLEVFTVIDALSNIELYKEGAVRHPVVATNHIEDFLAEDIKDLWAYYCTSQGKLVSNRFFGMPLHRTRILALQLYKFNIKGFLHWGFNFYNSVLSIRPIDPYRVTDADSAFPSGDAFVVYPGKDGKPEESIRLMVMARAMQDLRLLEYLESLTGRDFVLELIEKDLDSPLTFAEYPHDAHYQEALMNRVREAIAEAVDNGQSSN